MILADGNGPVQLRYEEQMSGFGSTLSCGGMPTTIGKGKVFECFVCMIPRERLQSTITNAGVALALPQS